MQGLIDAVKYNKNSINLCKQELCENIAKHYGRTIQGGLFYQSTAARGRCEGVRKLEEMRDKEKPMNFQF